MFALFLVSTVLNKMLMRPVITTTVLKERKEGEFRFKHLQVKREIEFLGSCLLNEYFEKFSSVKC